MNQLFKVLFLTIFLIIFLSGCRGELSTNLSEVVSSQSQFETLCGRLIFRSDDAVINGWWLSEDLSGESFQIRLTHLKYLDAWLKKQSPSESCVIYKPAETQRDFIAEIISPYGVYLKEIDSSPTSKHCGAISLNPLNEPTAQTQPRPQGLQSDIDEQILEHRIYIYETRHHETVNTPEEIEIPANIPELFETGACVYFTNIELDDELGIHKQFAGIAPLLEVEDASHSQQQPRVMCGTMIYRSFPEATQGFWLRESQSFRPVRLNLESIENQQELQRQLPAPVCVSYNLNEHPGWEETIKVITIDFNASQ